MSDGATGNDELSRRCGLGKQVLKITYPEKLGDRTYNVNFGMIIKPNIH